MTRSPVPLACLLAVSASLSATRALAQPRDETAADALFRDAKAAEARGDYPMACPKFAESQRLDPAPGTLLNLGDCEEHLGKLATAWEHFTQGRDGLRPGDDRLPFAQQRIAAIAKRLPHLIVRLKADAPEGTRVTRGTVPLGPAALGSPLAVDPGKQTLVVEAPGRARRTVTVDVREAESKEVLLEPGDDERAPATDEGGGTEAGAATASTTPSPSPSSLPRQRTIGWIVGGVGAAGLVASAVTGVMAFGAGATFNAHCGAGGACRDQQGLDAASAGKTYEALSTVAFLVGLAGAGVGAYLVLSDQGQATTTVGAAPIAGGAWLSLTRGF